METIDHLIRKSRKGSRQAQFLLYQHYVRPIYSTCLRIVGNAAEAEEATQDAFLKAFQQMDLCKEDGYFEPWLRRIAIHTAIDYVRRQKEEPEELQKWCTVDEEEDAPDEETIHWQVEQIRGALAGLATGYRTVLTLYLFEGYDMGEIAEIMHLNPSSVRSQYIRGKQKLREKMGV